MYTGNGEAAWPDMNSWVPMFDEMFASNLDIVQQSCTEFNVPNNSHDETNALHDAIVSAATSTSIDARFIFAVVVQESNGCVRAPTTTNSVRNPGLMQDHNGAATCNEGGDVQDPCPAATIAQMIVDGVAGTPSGDGLVQALAQAPGTGAAKYYGAARIYNSGSIASSGDLGAGVATHCYASDIANRLCGWVFAEKDCTLDGAPPTTPTTAVAVASTSAAPSSTGVYIPASDPAYPVANQLKAGSQSTAASAPSGCAAYYLVQAGDVCYTVAQSAGISLDEFMSLNPVLDSSCSNLQLGLHYCVKGA